MIITPTTKSPRRAAPILHLSDPGRIPPVAIVDSREQAPLLLPGLETVVRGLTSGDYSLVGAEHLFAVERKSLNDLVGCVTGERARFERELIRLRGYRFHRLLLVCTEDDIMAGRYRSTVTPNAVLSSLATWEARFDCPVVFGDTPTIAGILVANWIRFFARELVKDVSNMLATTVEAQAPVNQPEKQEA